MTPTPVLAGRYLLGEILGRGGMGTVYAALDQLLGRQVAVKVLEVAAADPAGTARFHREAQALAALEHPNVVTVHDFGTDGTRAWLVMPRLPGPDLQTLLNTRGPLPVAQIAEVGRQTAAALAAAHAAGIVHRDVKPANLMLAADGGVVLLDLGIARLTDGSAPLTGTGQLLGTVPYLAPEAISGHPPQPPADMYALGGVLFALLTGRPPFDGDGAAGLAQHLHAPPPAPVGLRPDTPSGLDQLVLALLAKDPAARPTAAQAVTVLEALALPATPPGPGTAGATPLAATRVLNPTRQFPQGVPLAHGQPAPQRRRRGWLLPAAAGAVLLALTVLVLLTTGGSQPSASAPGSSTAPNSASPTVPATAPSPSAAPSATDPVQAALDRLQAAISTAAASGALAAPDATDLSHRFTDLPQTLIQGKTIDTAHQITDFDHHLTALQRQGRLAPGAATQLRTALTDLRAALGATTSTQDTTGNGGNHGDGGDGGDGGD